MIFLKKLIGMILIILIAISYVKVIANKIPDEAIRIRVVANSNSDYDQKIKQKVSTYLKGEMYQLLKNTRDINQAREIISNNIEKIDNSIYSILKKENYNL